MFVVPVCLVLELLVGTWYSWYFVKNSEHEAQSTERTRAVRVHGAAHGTLRLKSERA